MKILLRTLGTRKTTSRIARTKTEQAATIPSSAARGKSNRVRFTSELYTEMLVRELGSHVAPANNTDIECRP